MLRSIANSLAVPSPGHITPLSDDIFPNRLVLNVPNGILRKLTFCSFASFLTVSLTSFNNNPESSRGLIMSKKSSISSFEFQIVPASTADAAAVNPNVIKTLLANGLITLFSNGKSVFGNGPKRLSRNLLNCIILDN